MLHAVSAVLVVCSSALDAADSTRSEQVDDFLSVLADDVDLAPMWNEMDRVRVSPFDRACQGSAAYCRRVSCLSPRSGLNRIHWWMRLKP